MRKLLLLLLCLSWSMTAFAMPSRIILIRAGEAPPNGNGLSQRGKERAAALVPFFLFQDYLQDYGHPVAIFAHRETQSEPSLRPVQTVTPLANALGIKVNTSFTQVEFVKMLKLIKENPDYEAKTILICWNNDNMSRIEAELGRKINVKPWPEEAHDRLWIVDFKQNRTINFRDIPQRLLYGDSEN